MASVGPSYFSTTLKQTTAGYSTWSNVDNARLNDGSYASSTVGVTTYSEGIRFKLSDLGLPNGGVITGITVVIYNRGSALTLSIYSSITDGADSGPNYYGFDRSTTVNSVNAWGLHTHGSSTDTRGLSATSLTTDWWNSGTSYLDIYAYNSSSSSSAVLDIDYVQITVNYTTNTSVVGFNAVATGENNTSTGTGAWSGPTNIYVSDNTRASVTKTAVGSSNYLVGRNCGFSIPSNATITGVMVIVENYSASPNTSTSFSVKLWNGSSTSTDSSIGTAKTWSPGTSESTWWFGGASDVWGATLTPAIVNSSSFGCGIQLVTTTSAPRTGYIDYVSIQVYYTVPPAAANCSVTNSLMMLGVGI